MTSTEKRAHAIEKRKLERLWILRALSYCRMKGIETEYDIAGCIANALHGTVYTLTTAEDERLAHLVWGE